MSDTHTAPEYWGDFNIPHERADPRFRDLNPYGVLACWRRDDGRLFAFRFHRSHKTQEQAMQAARDLNRHGWPAGIWDDGWRQGMRFIGVSACKFKGEYRGCGRKPTPEEKAMIDQFYEQALNQ